MPEPSLKAQAWALFDEIVATADLRDANPWRIDGADRTFVPDFDTLSRLLGVPIFLGATSQSGVPALALDVWTAYELRRAGFDPDRVWPRASPPRVLPYDVSALVDSLPKGLREQVRQRLDRGQSGGTASATANLLGKNYVKQVDVVMSSWQTGPELMISTKRMDSSFGKNAANRVEESYGDAKNLSLRYPQASLGFLYGLRSTAFGLEPDTALWLIDLLAKLGREDDAYDAVGLVVPEWSGGDTSASDDAADSDPRETAPTDIEPAVLADVDVREVEPAPVPVAELPTVQLRHDLVPRELSPARFFAVLVDRVLANSPINFHVGARELRGRSVGGG
jgi:hypothetical protein